MKKTFLLFWIKSGLCLALTACSAPSPTLAFPTESATRAPLATPRLVTPTPAASETAASAQSFPSPAAENTSAACAYVWASQPLDELSSALLASLQASGLNAESAAASAYGENCVDAGGAALSFSAMQTDYSIRLRVDDLQDEPRLGQMLYVVLLNLQARFPLETTPGPNPGQITLIFSAAGGETRLNFSRAEAVAALNAGKSGQEILGVGK